MRVLVFMRGQGGAPGQAGVPGGQIGMAKIAAALAQLGAHVHVFVSGPYPKYLGTGACVATSTMTWPLALDRLIARAPGPLRRGGEWVRRRVWNRAAANVLARVSPDVVHVQGLEDGAALLALHDGPTVITHWGRAARWHGAAPALPGITRDRAPGRAKPVLVAIGSAQAAEMAAVGLPPDEVIPTGLDTALFVPGDKAAARRRLGIDPGDGVVLYVGRLARDKNVGALLAAFAAVAATKPTARLVVVGDGPLAGALRRRTAALGVGPRVTYRRFAAQEELVHYYRAADVTAVPSDKLETFCMVALEAIASGCPLVVTDQVPEIASRFPDVAVVGAHDTAALRNVIGRAIEGGLPPARPVGLEQFTWASIARRYSDLFRALVARPSADIRSGLLQGGSRGTQS